MKILFISLVLLIPLSCLAGSQAVAVLLDVTKTIPRNDFRKSKEIIQQLVQQNASTDTLTLYAFGSELRKIDPAKLEATSRNDMKTSLYDALFDVAQSLEKTKADRKAIILITDGLDNSSATKIHDSMSFAENHKIAIYCIEAGAADRKSLERIAKITSGGTFQLGTPQLTEKIQQSIASQASVISKITTPTIVKPPQIDLRQRRVIPQSKPKQKQTSGLVARYRYLVWIVGGGVLFVPFIVWILMRSTKKQSKHCPGCNKPLESNQTFCAECASVPKTLIQSPTTLQPDSTQEIKRYLAAEPFDPPSLPPEVLMKQPDVDEALLKTNILIDKPMLVVRKGKNIGQSYVLNRSTPVSLGRSRVCEIMLEDATISGQHCRIVPQGGKHYLYDLRSTNGTVVNGKKVRKAELKEGDVIKVGETQFLYKLEQHRN